MLCCAIVQLSYDPQTAFYRIFVFALYGSGLTSIFPEFKHFVCSIN